MTEQNLYNITPEDPEESSFNLYELIFKYLVYWPWFVASVIICLVLAFVYLRYQAPVYNVTASVLIKEQDARSRAMSANGGALEALQSMGGFSMTNNFDNEVEILKSRTLIKKVVTHLGLYISTGEERFFGYARPLYQTSPIGVYMSPEEADKLEAGMKLHLTYTQENHLKVKAEYELNEEEETLEKTFDKLPAVLPTPVGVLSFTVNDSLLASWRENNTGSLQLVSYVNSPTAVAKAYGENLSVDAASKTTTIALVALQNTSRQRAVDFINCLVSLYNQDANDEKNEVAQKTAEFIEERLVIINDELGSTENRLADFKQRSGLTDLVSDAQLALQENSKYNQQRVQNETQISLVTFLRDYINNPSNRNEVIPSNVGLEDKGLSAAIDQYNAQLGERNRLLLTSSEENPAVVKLDAKKAAKKVQRWQQIAESAAKQAGRGYIPKVSDVMPFPSALELAGELDVCLIPYELAEGMEYTRSVIEAIRPGQSVGIFIGPEGGFEREEVDLALASAAKALTLGRRILRTETAGLAVLSVLMYHLES